MKKVKNKVSLKHQAFALEYLQCFNATEAYSRVYKRATRETAMRNGSDLLRIAEVNAVIQAHFKAKQMETDEVLGRLAEHARASHEPFIQITNDGFVYFDFSNPEAKKYLHLIKKIKTKRQRRVDGRGASAEVWEDEWVEVELHDQQRALELIGKHLKLFADRLEVEHTLNVDGLDKSLESIYGSHNNKSR